MISVRTKAILAASVLGLSGLAAQAAPFANVALLGRINGVGAFSASVTVTAGSVVEFRVVPTFLAAGAVNNQGGTTRTLAAFSGTDGFNILPRFDVINSTGIVSTFTTTDAGGDPGNGDPGPFVGSYGAGWGAATGHTTSLLGTNTPTQTKVGRGASNYSYPAALAGTQAYSFLSTFSIASVSTPSALLGIQLSTLAQSGSGAIRVKVGAGAGVQAAFTTADGTFSSPSSDPLFNYTGLTLVNGNVVSNINPSFTVGSGLQPGNTGVDLVLDPIFNNGITDLQTHFATFTIADALIGDETPGTVSVTLGTLPAALVGHVTLSNNGRQIVVDGKYDDSVGIYTAANPFGTLAIPLNLIDGAGAPGTGTLTLQLVPEPTSIGLLGLGGLALLRRRRSAK